MVCGIKSCIKHTTLCVINYCVSRCRECVLRTCCVGALSIKVSSMSDSDDSDAVDAGIFVYVCVCVYVHTCMHIYTNATFMHIYTNACVYESKPKRHEVAIDDGIIVYVGPSHHIILLLHKYTRAHTYIPTPYPPPSIAMVQVKVYGYVGEWRDSCSCIDVTCMYDVIICVCA